MYRPVWKKIHQFLSSIKKTRTKKTGSFFLRHGVFVLCVKNHSAATAAAVAAAVTAEATRQRSAG